MATWWERAASMMQPVNSPMSLSGLTGQDRKSEHGALGQLVVTADHGGRGVDVEPRAVMAEGQAADRLRRVQQRLLDEVRLGDLGRHVGGRHGDRVDLDVVERVDEAREVADVLLRGGAQLAVPGVDGLDALGEVGESDAPALKDDVLVGGAAAERDGGGRPADALLEHVLRDPHLARGAVDLAAAVGEQVERLVVLHPEAGRLEHLDGAPVDGLPLVCGEDVDADAALVVDA